MNFLIQGKSPRSSKGLHGPQETSNMRVCNLQLGKVYYIVSLHRAPNIPMDAYAPFKNIGPLPCSRTFGTCFGRPATREGFLLVMFFLKSAIYLVLIEIPPYQYIIRLPFQTVKAHTKRMSKHQFIVAGDPHEYDPEKWSSSSNALPKRSPETHVNVLIVGAGFGGLMTALECWRKGHNVVGILERSQGPNYSG